MNLTDLRSRIRRLEVLVAGLSKEVSLWKDSNAPVLYVDRLEYLAPEPNVGGDSR